MVRLTGFLIGIYPIVAHLGLWTSQPRLAVSYLVGLLLFVLLYPPRFLQLKNILTAGILIIGVVSLAEFDLDYILIYLPPVVIPTALMVVFMQSLGEERTPLITQFAITMEGSLDAEREVYTRRVTQLWAGIFAFMALAGIGLAIWAPIEIWSWVIHIGNYVLIALVLILEFIYRHHRFKSNPSSFKQFISALVKHRWK